MRTITDRAKLAELKRYCETYIDPAKNSHPRILLFLKATLQKDEASWTEEEYLRVKDYLREPVNVIPQTEVEKVLGIFPASVLAAEGTPERYAGKEEYLNAVKDFKEGKPSTSVTEFINKQLARVAKLKESSNEPA